jgi:hypothetical protein
LQIFQPKASYKDLWVQLNLQKKPTSTGTS